MCPILTCLALAFVGGVDLGYQPAPDGKLELIVHIDPVTFQTLRPGDPISLAVKAELQQFPASKITVNVDNATPTRIMPPPSSSRSTGPLSGRGAAAAPETAPFVQASPLPSSPVMPATAESPIGASGGPSLGPAGEPVRVGAPTGTPVAPTTTNEQTQGAADTRAGSTLAPGQAGNGSFSGMEPVNGGKLAGTTIDRWDLMLYLFIIGLAASNGYVGWLFYDARQRYIGLLSRKFAAAQ